MKKKMIEKLEQILPPYDKGEWVTAFNNGEYLVIEKYVNGSMEFRHAIRLANLENATWFPEQGWTTKTFMGAVGGEWNWAYSYYEGLYGKTEKWRIAPVHEQVIRDALHPILLKETYYYPGNIWECIEKADQIHGQTQRKRAEEKRLKRIDDLMSLVPEYDEKVKAWFDEVMTGGSELATMDSEKKYGCSVCEGKFDLKEARRTDGSRNIRHNDMIYCPHCGAELKVIKRKQGVSAWSRVAIMNNLYQNAGCVTYIDLNVEAHGGKKEVNPDEAVRIILYREQAVKGWPCRIYYNQDRRGIFGVDWDDQRNSKNRREGKCLLYPEGIAEAMQGTMYEEWSGLFQELAKDGRRMDFNRLMATSGRVSDQRGKVKPLFEMLYRNRFYRLMEEESDLCSLWSGEYCGNLTLSNDIREVFQMDDKQAINRIRDINGGRVAMEWIRYAARRHEKLKQEVLKWLSDNSVETKDMKWLSVRMSLEQAMNFINRQRAEQYKSLTVRGVINQYNDYMDLIKEEKKDTTDPMNYRPRELKRRHDEAVERRNERIRVEEMKRNEKEAKRRAKELSAKFPEAEAALHEIREKFTWEGEGFKIIVPQTLMDITLEGVALHHCAGGDRYYDRMAERETFILCMRAADKPHIPLYTMEVEPTGTVRQLRQAFDEEVKDQKVKEAIKKWQKDIRKRMKEADREQAKVSKQKRIENDAFLRQKSSHPLKDKIIAGLERDLMEVAV